MSFHREAIKPWDFVLTPIIQHQVQARRINPDGELRKVGYKKIGGVRRNAYPWDKMEDGDFFIVPITKSSEAQKNGIRQAAARKNIEVAIRQWYIEDRAGKMPALRVTRVQGNMALIRYVASLYCPNIPMGFDVKGCAERVRRWRAERKAEDSSIGHTESTDSEDA